MRLRSAIPAILGATAIGASTAQAGSFNVTTTSDTGAGSLRQAIIDANASSDATDTIVFTNSIAANSTITLATPLDNITNAALIFDAAAVTGLTINGPGTSNFLTYTTTSANAQFHTNINHTDGSITFSESDTGAIDGTLRGGNLVLIKTGTGTTTLEPGGVINLTGASSAIRVEQGTFDVDGTVTASSATSSLLVASGATLVLDGTAGISGSVTNEGTLLANGTLTAGSLVVDPGASLGVSGAATVGGALTNRGTVDVTGTLTAGSLVVESGGVLTGNSGATNVNAPVTMSGRIAPSTAAGRLGISGPVTFGPSSTFEAEIGPGNAGDRIQVTGAVTIEPGARLDLVPDPTIAITTVPVLTASAITGQFTATDFAFFVESFNYQPTSLTVTLTSTGQNFSSFAGTPNQRAVAQLLEAAAPTATDDLQAVFDSLNTALAGEVAPLLDAIGGESLTAFATARQVLGERTARALHRRTRDPAWGDGRAFYLGEDPEDVRQGDERPLIDRVRPGVWLDGLGLFGELEGDTGEAEVDTLLYGGTLGADAWIADRFVVGLAAGYARSDVDLDHREVDVFGDTVQGALYAGFADPRGFVSAYGRYAYTFQDSTRRIESSTLSRHAHADWDAQDYGAGAEAGLTVASFAGVALQPIVGVDWLRLTEEDFTESDAGSLNLIVDPETLETTAARFGGRIFGHIDMGDVATLAPEVRAFYQQLSGDRERVLDARLSSAPQLGVTGVRGPEFPRESVILGLGWGVRVGENLTVSLDYDSVIGSDRVEHQGNIAARVAF